jgi:hypothetical protein
MVVAEASVDKMCKFVWTLTERNTLRKSDENR